MYPLAGDLATVFLRIFLHHPGQFLLQPARQVDTEIPLQHVGDTALAGLGIDPHHFLVATAHIRRVDGQIGHLPDIAFLVAGQALADSILMTAGESAEDQIARIGMARVGLDIGDLLHQGNNLLHPRKVDLRIDALAVQVHPGGDQIHVPGPFAVAQQGAFHSIRTGHDSHFRRRHTTAPVIVGMHADDHVLTILNVLMYKLYLVGKHIGRAHLHRGRQVDDHPLTLVRAPYRIHRIDHFDGEIGFRGTEGFRGILEAPVGFRLLLGTGFHPAGSTLGNGLAAGLVHAEHLLAEGGRGGIVDMHDGIFCALE